MAWGGIGLLGLAGQGLPGKLGQGSIYKTSMADHGGQTPSGVI